MAKDKDFPVITFFKQHLNKHRLVLLVIFLLALFLRTIFLSSVPFSFHTDEIINGYVGRFILSNGKDLYGNFLPFLYFDKFGDYRVVLPMYLFGASTFFFGLNEFGVRFASSFFGALMVIPVYLLARLAISNKKIALVSAFFLAILPWHIVLSRASSEGVIGLTVFSFTIYFLIKGILSENFRMVAITWIPLLFTYFMYPSFRVLSPLVLLPLPFLYPQKNKRLILVLGVVLFVSFTFLVSTTQWGKGRYEQTSLLSNKEVSARIKADNEAYSFDEGNNSAFTARLFHNKAIGYVKVFTEEYFNYVSPSFLFIKGGLPYRYTIPGMGLIFITFSILLLFALLPIKVYANSRLIAYFVYLLAIAPIPGALTMEDSPNTHRVLLMILPIILLAGYGLYKTAKVLENRHRLYLYGFVTIFSGFLLLEFVYFSHQYMNHTASLKSILRNDGMKDAALYIKENISKYDSIYVPAFETMPVYYLFYTGDTNGKYAGEFSWGVQIKSIDNITFVKDWCPTKIMKKEEFIKNSLIIENGDCEFQKGYKEVKVFYRKDSTRAFKAIIPI